jgi:hypothetical protein
MRSKNKNEFSQKNIIDDKKQLLLETESKSENKTEKNQIDQDGDDGININNLNKNNDKVENFIVYKGDALKESWCLSKIFFYWAFRIILVRNSYIINFY